MAADGRVRTVMPPSLRALPPTPRLEEVSAMRGKNWG
jgi:hypothetical protein